MPIAGDREGQHRERQDGRGGRAEQADAEQRDRRPGSGVRSASSSRGPSSEPASIPQPKALTSSAKPVRAAVELVVGEHELGDVGRAGHEHDGAGGQDERADERLAQDAEQVGRAASSPRSAGVALRWPRRRVSRRAEAAKVTALSASTSSGSAKSRTPAATRGADQLADLAHGAEDAVGGGQAVGVHDRGQQRAGRGAKQGAADAGEDRQGDQLGRAVGEDQARRTRSRRSRRRRSRSRAGCAVDQAAEQRAEQHRRERDRRSAPRSRPRPSRAARRRAAAAPRSRRRCRARPGGGRRRTSGRGVPSATLRRLRADLRSTAWTKS